MTAEGETIPRRAPDRFDEMAIAWFAKLPSLASEIYARRYLARFLREAVEKEVAAERERVVALMTSFVGGCKHVVHGQLCGQPAAGVSSRPAFAQEGTCVRALCEACAGLPDAVEGSSAWLRFADLSCVQGQSAPRVMPTTEEKLRLAIDALEKSVDGGPDSLYILGCKIGAVAGYSAHQEASERHYNKRMEILRILDELRREG